jgi:hypothetical protein
MTTSPITVRTTNATPLRAATDVSHKIEFDTTDFTPPDRDVSSGA